MGGIWSGVQCSDSWVNKNTWIHILAVICIEISVAYVAEDAATT